MRHVLFSNCDTSISRRHVISWWISAMFQEEEKKQKRKKKKRKKEPPSPAVSWRCRLRFRFNGLSDRRFTIIRSTRCRLSGGWQLSKRAGGPHSGRGAAHPHSHVIRNPAAGTSYPGHFCTIDVETEGTPNAHAHVRKSRKLSVVFQFTVLQNKPVAFSKQMLRIIGSEMR